MAKPRNRYGFILQTNYNSNLQTDTEYHEIHAIFTQSCMQTIKYMTDKTVMQVNHKDKTRHWKEWHLCGRLVQMKNLEMTHKQCIHRVGPLCYIIVDKRNLHRKVKYQTFETERRAAMQNMHSSHKWQHWCPEATFLDLWRSAPAAVSDEAIAFQ